MKDFDQLIVDIEAEAVAEGPAAVAELVALDDRFRLASGCDTRKQAHLSQKELSRRSGVQQAEISEIERGEVVPTLTTMNKLLHPLGRRWRSSKITSPLRPETALPYRPAIRL